MLEQEPTRDDMAEVTEDGDPQEPEEPQVPLEPHVAVLQGFQAIAQTLLVAYGDASSEVHTVTRWALRASTNDDWAFVFGASNAIRQWVGSVRPAMACMEMPKGAKDPSQLLADVREAEKVAIDSILSLILDQEEPRLPPIFPRADLEPVLGIAHCHTDAALWNVHSQLSDLVREPKQALNRPEYSLTPSCQSLVFSDSRWMRWPSTNFSLRVRSFPPCGALGGESLMGPPSCSASWPASLVERVTPVPGPSEGSG